MKVSDDWSYALAGIERDLCKAREYLTGNHHASAWAYLSKMQDRIEQAKWYCRERMESVRDE